MIQIENALGTTLIPGKISSYQTEMIVINIDNVVELSQNDPKLYSDGALSQTKIVCVTW